MKSIRDSKKLYWGLIITFFVLYALVGFVSTLHSITFFQLANSIWMAVLLGLTYEIGQASVLFSILMTKNRQKILPWVLMLLLTGLQVTANVYASFKFMDSSGSIDWTYWQRSILFWLEVDGPEMFKVVISWITGALLPIVALGMTALVAENLKLKDEETEIENLREKAKKDEDQINFDHDIDELNKYNTFNEKENLENLRNKIVENTVKEESSSEKNTTIGEGGIIVEKPHIEIDLEKINLPSSDQKQLNTFQKVHHLQDKLEKNEEKSQIEINNIKLKNLIPSIPKIKHTSETDQTEFFTEKDHPENFDKDPATGSFEKKPINNQRGWHLKKEFIDDNGDIYNFGQLQKDKKKDDSESLKKV